MVKIQSQHHSRNRFKLTEDCSVTVGVTPDYSINTDFINLGKDGDLVIKKGYAWDGLPGLVLHTKNIRRGSVVRDALYQLMRNQHLSNGWRTAADMEFKRFCIEDGCSKFRAWFLHRQLRSENSTAVVYEIVRKASPTQPKVVSAIHSVQPLLESFDEPTLYTLFKSSEPIGPQLRVSELPEGMLRSLTGYHLEQIAVVRKRARERRGNFWIGVGSGAGALTALTGLAALVLRLLGKM